MLKCIIFLLCSGLVVPAVEPERPSARFSRGFGYIHDEVPAEPWSIHIVKVDRSYTNLQLHTALGKGGQIGLSALSEQVKLLPKDLGRPLAAINGDYYRDEGPYAGDPKGLQILRGELVSAPCGWTCFWIDSSGNPRMTNVNSRFEAVWPNGEKSTFGLNEERQKNGVVLYTTAVGASTRTKGGRDLILARNGTGPWLPLQVGQVYSARVKAIDADGNAPLTSETMVLSIGPQVALNLAHVQAGTVIQFSTSTAPGLTAVNTALSGGPALVRGGIALSRDEVKVRNPRSAIGWNRDYFYILQVDGRQRNLSRGMTTNELASYMAKLGCDSAMSLDGGGSVPSR